jgi:hypothetical protein
MKYKQLNRAAILKIQNGCCHYSAIIIDVINEFFDPKNLYIDRHFVILGSSVAEIYPLKVYYGGHLGRHLEFMNAIIYFVLNNSNEDKLSCMFKNIECHPLTLFMRMYRIISNYI